MHWLNDVEWFLLSGSTRHSSMQLTKMLVQGAAVHEVFTTKVASKACNRAMCFAMVVESRHKGIRLVAHFTLIQPAHWSVPVHVALQSLLIKEAPIADVAWRMGHCWLCPDFSWAPSGGLVHERDQWLKTGVTWKLRCHNHVAPTPVHGHWEKQGLHAVWPLSQHAV